MGASETCRKRKRRINRCENMCEWKRCEISHVEKIDEEYSVSMTTQWDYKTSKLKVSNCSLLWMMIVIFVIWQYMNKNTLNICIISFLKEFVISAVCIDTIWSTFAMFDYRTFRPFIVGISHTLLSFCAWSQGKWVNYLCNHVYCVWIVMCAWLHNLQ